MKIFKKVISIIMASVMTITAFAVTSSAASIEDTAVKITSGKTYSATLHNSGDRSDYKIVVSKAGKLKINLTCKMSDSFISVFDSNGTEIDCSDYTNKSGNINSFGTIRWNSTVEKFSGTITYNVSKGTYYARVSRSGQFGGSGSGKLNFTATFPSSSSSSSAKISYLSLTIPKNSSIQLGAILSAKSSSSVKWSSSKSSVASVSSKGKVTAKKKGSAVITAKLGSSSIKIKINVK